MLCISQQGTIVAVVTKIIKDKGVDGAMLELILYGGSLGPSPSWEKRGPGIIVCACA